ncbi:TPA: type VI secretion system-associated FHA domain protein TagH [Pseudomonas aeruginosa]|uniref:type VI secretion system-associated FHA domain protein TagH n=1 Tax=Pseudomonas aeruginosa TaxID=287 RepID=UPI0010688F40|nr:type VI secretion system-associated FHA domain protein TagH [Pseudomonas aeruginosa]MBI7022696.1 type VI secretion system-associated FHA domain protein TagH [Pseudomonas aeruginosa]MBI9166535.1 type VI secretion system-associated FHA domain protein TagH [Pseudomonas aeruginosa]MCY0312126.1 type VI secretion system-associated FHA domain protein TagH [Pseudomonas aeruginosa]MCY0514208.1 type VI secretion system-associated FHA domain protein TagH [Pseudomonas aeruginosa]QPZ69521.1 type VI secr
MELVLEMLSAKQFVPTELCSKTFGRNGGLIGRGGECDWAIPDRKRHLSKQHARVSYRNGAFYLTDTSSNGIRAGNGSRLPHGEPQRIEQDSVFLLGDFEIRARLLREPDEFAMDVGRPQPAGSIIPDDAFLALDPLQALDQDGADAYELDDLSAIAQPSQEAGARADYARIDMESLVVPELVPAPVAPQEPVDSPRPGRDEAFWQRFGQALGVDLEGLDGAAREALAINAAGLLRQCIGGLQQSLRTRSELKNELRLSLSTLRDTGKNPLRFSGDAGEALGHLLRDGKPGQLSGEQAVARSFRDLQAHQVALLGASRAAVRATLEHFSPQQLTLRFERDGRRPLLATSGSRWRAYGRYHQSLCQDDDWSERLLARDFAQAYEEQVRLISTLYTEHQG